LFQAEDGIRVIGVTGVQTCALPVWSEWDQIGLEGRRYVERWHHPKRIAKALNRIYKDPSAPFEILEAS